MSKPTQRTLEFDLSAGARRKEKISIDSPWFKLTVVPGTVDIFLDPSEPKPITVSGPKEFCTSDGEPFSDIFLSHEIGSGVLEILTSPTVRITDFSPGTSAARLESILLHIVPRDYSGGSNLLTKSSHFDLEDSNILTRGVSGDGVCRTTYNNNKELQGLELGCPAGLVANSYGLAFNPSFAIPACNLLNTPLVTHHHGRDFYYSASDALHVGRAWGSGADAMYATFGLGSISLQAGAVLSGYLVGFMARETSPYWHATIYEKDGPGYEEHEELVGYRADEVQEMDVRMGTEDGAPYVQWFINGLRVHEYNLPCATDVVIGAGEWTLNWMAARENAGNLDAIILMGLLSGGAILKVVYPNG